MISVSEISSTSLFSLYSQIAMIFGLIQFYQFYIDRYLPARFKVYLFSLFDNLFNPRSSSDLILIIEEFEGFTFNELYESSETYLGTKTDPSVDRLKVRKAAREKSLLVTIAKGQEVTDIFQGIKLKWNLVISENSTASSGSNPQYNSNHYKPERRFFELSFEKKYKDQVLSLYLPHVVEKAKALKVENNVVKLYSLGIRYGGDMEGGQWGSVNLDHPSNFDTLALDSDVKTELINDLDRFLKRRDYYKKVGKVWKRGYLLYGPPGTGKSSLVAAMANYLKFDIYDLELTSIASDSQLRSLLVSTKNRSILVIEDIDCGAKIQDREYVDDYIYNSNQFSLSGLLNFVDGLWSSCGDERIIIFTTNHKDKIDPALLRPGRMDMHIHMSYCSFFGFKLLASNYLGIQDDHPLFEQIEELLGSVKVTPAEIAEELMKNDDSEVALECLVQFLMRKITHENATLDEEKEVDYDRELANENKDSCQ